MIEIKRGTVIAVTERRRGLLECVIDKSDAIAIAYPDLTGPVRVGDRVILNTTAVTLGLGTGGSHFVIAVEQGPEIDLDPELRAMKLRYTPMQTSVGLVEESGDLPDAIPGVPVVAAGLHSALVPAVIGIEKTRPGSRIGFVHTDGAALPVAFSDAVGTLREQGRLHVCVSAGQSFGGDVEAVNIWSALLAACAHGAEIVVVAMGPGNLGTESKYGFALLEQAAVLNAAGALDGLPIAIPRIGFSDKRKRHQVVSHHTLTALGSPTLVHATIPVAPMDDRHHADQVHAALEALSSKHAIVEVPVSHCEEALAGEALLSTMGRGFSAEPDYFRTAAAAGVFAARAINDQSH